MISRYKKLCSILILAALISSSIGCDAFIRKFTRKKQHQEEVEPVLNPELKSGLFFDNDTKYKNYFTYWRGWHDELIESITSFSKKRKKYCLEQAIMNLERMGSLLKEEKQTELRTYIEKMEKIGSDINNEGVLDERIIVQQLSNIRLALNKKFHFSKVENWIKQ
ncbi:MAG: hypothetical protein AB1629_06330 [Candidatus Omnitrophota bacterium]